MSEPALKRDLKSFLLRLVGRAPDQVEAQRSFEESLRKVADQENVLEDILKDLDKINDAARKKQKRMGDLRRTLDVGVQMQQLVPNNGKR